MRSPRLPSHNRGGATCKGRRTKGDGRVYRCSFVFYCADGLHLGVGGDELVEPALCRLYRHSFVAECGLHLGVGGDELL